MSGLRSRVGATESELHARQDLAQAFPFVIEKNRILPRRAGKPRLVEPQDPEKGPARVPRGFDGRDMKLAGKRSLAANRELADRFREPRRGFTRRKRALREAHELAAEPEKSVTDDAVSRRRDPRECREERSRGPGRRGERESRLRKWRHLEELFDEVEEDCGSLGRPARLLVVRRGLAARAQCRETRKVAPAAAEDARTEEKAREAPGARTRARGPHCRELDEPVGEGRRENPRRESPRNPF